MKRGPGPDTFSTHMQNSLQQLQVKLYADGADKAARFLQLCDAFELPVVFLCDTPGIMAMAWIAPSQKHCASDTSSSVMSPWRR